MTMTDWKKVIPSEFSNYSRVWVYQGNRAFTADEKLKVGKVIAQYVDSWMSHGRPVKGWGTVLFDQFIVLLADDTSDKLCGSAIDSSIRFMKELESKLGIELLNRMNLGFSDGQKLFTVPMQELETALEAGEIQQETLFFNNTVSSKKELLENWIQPIKESFLANRISLN
ncbi:MAG TPA: hypothetical protein VK084_07005 [Chitinophagaceae bacterium]|nr:hypothetical protein [Chitinophagaceae bacterium]